MRYHSVKMKEINENLKYLWNKTYQGTGGPPCHFFACGERAADVALFHPRPDIDNILIRSDADSTKVSATKTNYNYRVSLASPSPASVV